MKKHYIREKLALQEVAAANNTTVEEVRKEIMIAMEAGLSNPDAAVQALWREIPCKGDKPTPEEFIAFIKEKVKKESNGNSGFLN